MDLRDKKVCFLGDSITAGGAASAPEKSFVGLFGLKYPTATIINYGLGGTRIAKKTSPSDKPQADLDFNLRVPEMENDADLVVVFGGVNDFGSGDAPLGQYGDETDDTFYGALYTLYENLIKKYPYGKILVVTPLHCEGENVPNHQGNKLEEYVVAVRKTAELFSFPVLDLYAVSGMNPAFGRVKEIFMPDGLHPNDLGHQRLFELMDVYIVNYL